MSEKRKLRSSASVMQVVWLFLSVVLVAIIFSVGMYVSSQMVHTRYSSDMEAFYQIAGLKDMLYQCDESMSAYLRSGNRANLIAYNNGVREFMLFTDGLKKASAEVTGRSLLYSIEDAFSSYQSSSNYAAHYFYGKQNVPAYDALYEARRISTYIKEYCDLLLETYIESGYDHYNSLETAQKSALVMEALALLLLMAGAVLGIRTLHSNFARPLSCLYDASTKISEGDFDVAVPEEYGDETMRSLSRTYNTMAMSIQRMVEDLNWAQKVKTELLNEQLKNTEYQRLLEQASFLALQSQVNPHFMFNTLNSISRTIMLGRSDDAVSMIDALAVLLRYNLADAYAPATLSEELEVIRQYMTIQQCRFPDRIHAEYKYDPALANAVQIPRFTLQPIVENAVIHGLEPKLGPGTLHIEAKQDGDVCQIDIWDDGVGMSRETLEAVLTGTHRGRKGHTNSIGVNNTKKRMQVFTHMEDCFHMESEPGKGMLVRLRLPVPGKEKKEEKPDV